MRQKTQTTKESQPRSPNAAFDATRRSQSAGSSPDIVQLILEDHLPLKSLIETLKDDTRDRTAKGKPLEEFAYLLTCHARAEEESLYVAMKNFEVLKIPSFEGDTEHARADQLVQEINATPDDNEWLAKVKVLAESVGHHIDEEEKSMLKKVEQAIPPAQRSNLGAEYLRLMGEYQMLFDIKIPKIVRFKNSSSRPANHI